MTRDKEIKFFHIILPRFLKESIDSIATFELVSLLSPENFSLFFQPPLVMAMLFSYHHHILETVGEIEQKREISIGGMMGSEN